MDTRRTLARLFFALLFLRSALSFAHAVEFPKRDTLRLSRQGLTLRVQYVVQTSDEAQVLRRLFDRDRSGSLDARERQALLSHLCRQATAFLRLSFDGKSIDLITDRAELGEDAASVDIILSAPLIEKLTSGRHQLRLFDRHKDRRIAVPIRISANEVRIHSALPPLVLLAAEKPLDLEVDFTAK